MTGAGQTTIVVVAVTTVATLWDIYAQVKLGEGATISEVLAGAKLWLASGGLRTWARRPHPMVPFAWGILSGHLWWQMACACP